jgi:hypothetical protein
MTTTSDQGRKIRYLIPVALVLGAMVTAGCAGGAPMGGPVEFAGYCPDGHPVAGWSVGIDVPDDGGRAQADAVMEAHNERCQDEARQQRFRYGGSGSE